MRLDKYAKNIDKMLWQYLGHSHEYLVILAWIREQINKSDLVITIQGTSEGVKYLKNQENVVTDVNLDDYGTVKVFKTSPVAPHTLEVFLEDFPIEGKLCSVNSKQVEINVKANFPHQAMNSLQLEKNKELAKKMGMEPVITENPTGELPVFGVECVAMWIAAKKGLKISCSKYSIGFNLLKRFRSDLVLFD